MLNVKNLLAKIVPLLDYTKTDMGYVSPADYSCTTGTTRKEFGNFTLPAKGIYLVKVYVQFAANNNGQRVLEVGTTSGGAAAALTMKDSRPTTGGGQGATLQCVFMREVTGTSEKLYVNGWQNSGSTLTAAPRIQYIRLR